MTAAVTFYLAFMAFLYAFNMTHGLVMLGKNKYPRIETRTPGWDVLGVVLSGGLFVWVMLLLL